jgi:uncharacterized protein YcbX
MQTHTHTHTHTHTYVRQSIILGQTSLLLTPGTLASSLYRVTRFIKQVKFRGNLIIAGKNHFTSEENFIFYIRKIRFLTCTNGNEKNVDTFKNNTSVSVFYC